MFTIVRNAKAALSTPRLLRKLINDIGGFAAVEFAMIVPIMIMMLLGSVEISDALTVDGRINIVASSISDMVARTTPITKSDLKDVLKFGHLLIGKYPLQSMTSEVVSLEPDVNGAMKVVWSFNSNGSSPYAAGANYPGSWDGMVSAPNSLIVVKTKFVYTSPIGQYIHGSITLSHTANNVSRISAVKCTDC